MNRWAHALSAFSAVAHILIGLPDLVNRDPRFTPASWRLLYEWLGGFWWLYPGLFVATGLAAAWGVRCPKALRLGFYLSACCFAIWGLAGLVAYSRGLGGNIPGSTANLYIAGCCWVLARYVTAGERSDQIDERVAALGEQVHQAVEAQDATSNG